MAKFEGGLQDFHKHVGPQIRNDVATITKKKKSELNSICQKCNATAELDAAHIHGRSRKDIIKIVLERYKSDNGLYLIPNLHKATEEIKAQHIPVEDNFYFLCKKCHREYDSKQDNQHNFESAKLTPSKSMSAKTSQVNTSLDGGNSPNEILSKDEITSWKYKMGWTSIQNRKNIKELISKIESTLDCNPFAIKSWYYHKRKDNNRQFSGIICHKNHSIICFRIRPGSFDIKDDRIIRGKRWFFPEGQEGRVEIIPQNYELIMKCLYCAYDISI